VVDTGTGRQSAAQSESHPIDLLASYALDALEEDERNAVDAHLSGCAQCQVELVHLQTAVDALPLAAPAVVPPARARARLLQRIASDQGDVVDGVDGTVQVNQASQARPRPQVPQRPRQEPIRMAPPPSMGNWSTWGGWAVATASVAVAAFTGWQSLTAQQQAATLRTEVASLHATVREHVTALDQIDPAQARLAAVRGAGSTATIQGRLVYQPDGQTVLAVLENLPALEPDHVYQLWLMPRAPGAAPVSAGTLLPGPSGAGSLVIRTPARLGGFTGIGLTAEPSPGRSAPSGPVLANGTL